MARADDAHLVGGPHNGLELCYSFRCVIVGGTIRRVARPVLTIGGHDVVPLVLGGKGKFRILLILTSSDRDAEDPDGMTTENPLGAVVMRKMRL